MSESEDQLKISCGKLAKTFPAIISSLEEHHQLSSIIPPEEYNRPSSTCEDENPAEESLDSSSSYQSIASATRNRYVEVKPDSPRPGTPAEEESKRLSRE